MTSITPINGKKDPLDSAINALVITMAADYGNIYKNQFQSEADVTHFKQRLRSRLGGLKLENIRRGYEVSVLASPKFCPTAVQIVAAVMEEENKSKRAEKNLREAERIGALPPPTRTINPIQLLREARARIQEAEKNMTKAEKWAEHLKRLAAHEKLIAAHESRTKKTVGAHGCAVAFCGNPGTMSSLVSGATNFYCKDHFRAN